MKGLPINFYCTMEPGECGLHQKGAAHQKLDVYNFKRRCMGCPKLEVEIEGIDKPKPQESEPEPTPKPVKCNAKTKAGKPCGNWAQPGKTKCSTHKE